jgi:branched-chain amino acid transport system substrate-binding protein
VAFKHAKKLVISVAVVMAAAGCGSSSKQSTNPGTSPTTGGQATGTQATGGQATGSPILVGSIGTYSGPLASSFGGIQATLNAWVSNTNANGGINGHPVKLILKDDAGLASTAVADVQELIQQHVVAIAADESTSDADWAKVVAKAGIPVVGGNAIDIPFMTNPDFFASSTNAIAAVWGVMSLGKTFGPKQAILACAEVAACAASEVFYKQFAPPLGMSIPYTQTIAASSPDYTAVCQGIKSSGSQSYVMIDAAGIVARVGNSCVQQGVTAHIVEASAAIEPSLLKAPGANGMLSVAVDFPFTDTSTPASQAFHTAIDKYAPAGTVVQWGPGLPQPWVSMELLKAAILAGGNGPVTAQSIKTGLYTLKNDTLGGLAPPLTFTQGQVNLQNCYFVLGISNGQFTAPQGLKTSCAPDALVAAGAKAMAAATGG